MSLARRVDGVATPTAPHAIRSRVTRRAAHSVLESLDNTCVHLAGMLLLLALSTTIVRPTLEFTSRRASLHRSAAADPLVHRIPDGTHRRAGSVMLGDLSMRGPGRDGLLTYMIAAPVRNSPLHRLRGGARICTGKRTSNMTWAAFPRSFCGWYCLGVAMLGAFGLLWPENWKKSDSIKFALIGLILMSLDVVLDALILKN